MPHFQNTTSINSELSDRTLTMNLIWEGEKEILIRSCEIFGQGCRSRFSFTENKHMEDVLTPKLARKLAETLPSTPESAQVLSLPDFLVDLSGLILSGLHIMVSEACEGVHSIILRFKEFLGSICQAFRIELGIETSLVPIGQKLATSVLQEICLPILNLCHVLENLARTEGQAVNPKLLSRTQEFYFQTELLKRFVSNAPDGTGRTQLDFDQRHTIADQNYR